MTTTPPLAAVPVSAGTVREWCRALTSLAPTTDTERCDLLRRLEELTSAAAAAQALLAVDLDASQRCEQEATGVRAADRGRGVASQVALARRESPSRGARHLGLAHALVEELPCTFEALQRGETTEWRATIVARETACLSREDRAAVDRELALLPGGLEAMGDRAVLVASRRLVYRIDPLAFTRRAAKAESERRVTLRPAPDTMAQLSGLLPVRQGVAVFASLTEQADSLRSAGDPRTRGQIMADTLVERVTGQSTAEAVPMEVRLVMSDEALLSADPDARATPAHVEGYGPIPSSLARAWVVNSDAEVWVRRLYADPRSGSLVAMDSRRRAFRGLLRSFVVTRDDVCRTPWCGAPIRHLDHPHRAADGGPTSGANGQGLCEACNLAKEAPGWRARASGEVVETETPTGHRFTSRPPPLVPPRIRPRRAGTTRAEWAFRDLVLMA